jgi:ATP-dependent exoDNAse (exonuclease V) alpha subunit
VLAAWQHDQQQGLDALMLAPARDQVADLNQRARTARLAGHTPTLEIDLADGNRASVGDLIITRRNDRRLTHGRDWVRNGDRWTVTALTPAGGMRATHQRTGKSVTLPAGYVREAVELGYATTIHTAQGVTADTTHGLVDEMMTREQLYTMISRGRTANHLYLSVGGDGDPHGILQADVSELTAADVLGRVLSRTSLAATATTIRRQEQTAADLRRRLHTPRPSHGQSYRREPVARPAGPGR